MNEIFNLLRSEIEYFKKLKVAIGDLHGHIHSLAVKTAKIYLSEKYNDVKHWEVSEKYGSGMDIVGKDKDQKITVVAEVKTTFRAKKEMLGAQQRKKIKEDIDRLNASGAENKYLFVIDNKNKKAIESILKSCESKNIKLINIFEC